MYVPKRDVNIRLEQAGGTNSTVKAVRKKQAGGGQQHSDL